MATLAPGALLNLLEGMNTGAKPTGEHHSSLLQVADIVPAHLDHDSLWPTRGFFLKVSDSSHSVYASLPPDQDDAVLTDKLQLGQFIYVDMFEPGSPVPVIRGLKPIPGRHPLMGMPKQLLSLTEIGCGRSVSVAPSSSSPPPPPSSSSARRGSWGSRGKALADSIRGPAPMSLKPIPSEFDRSSPARGRKTVSPVVRRGVRSSYAGGLLTKAEYKVEGAASTRRSSMTPASKVPRSRSVACDRDTTLPTRSPNSAKNSVTPPRSSSNFGRSPPIRVNEDGQGNSSSKQLVKSKSQTSGSSSPSLNLPGRLGILGKEAVQRREAAQKVALRSLREASATETMVRSLKMFASLTEHAKAEAPGTCFNQFLEFHRQTMQAVNDMASIHAATSENSKDEMLDVQGKVNGQESQVLNDITGTSDQASARRLLPLHKSGKTSSNVSSTPAKVGDHNSENNENKKPVTSCCSLTDTIKLGKEIETETGKWFMDFVEKALELGLQKSKGLTKGDVKTVSQALLIKVVNWIEVNQFDKNKQPLHPKAQLIARKLRIKMKNP